MRDSLHELLIMKNQSGTKYYLKNLLLNSPDIAYIGPELVLDIHNHQERNNSIWYLISYRNNNHINNGWINEVLLQKFIGLLNYKIKHMLN